GREDFYLQYLTRGEMEVSLFGESRIMRPGQVILYYPHTAYQYTMRGALIPLAPRQEVQYYWVHFTGYQAADLVERCGIPNQTFITVADGLSLQLEYEGLFQDFIRRDPLFELSASTRITSLLLQIGRALRGTAKEETDGRIQHALSQIHQHYREELSVREMAREAHLSESHFRSLFKDQTGLSPKDYLTSLRLSRARMLLMQTTEPLQEIAEAVGYPDQMYFSRIFRDRIGVSPSEYRRGGGRES
ncbi:MAG: helix-turn-helix transcriptional regulator, partial [Lachnospiraceae bacterium]|nr:helix-turn-helix transcriptional regulator [Lachnospiraceae bacterium]